MRRIVAIGVLYVFTLVLAPAFAQAPEGGVIDPGRNIGPAALGMAADKLLGSLGKADFQKDNDDGSTLYEWGLLTQSDLPDAVLWALVDGDVVAKVGTDGGKYQTSSGLGVGSSAEEFVRAFGSPAKNPLPDSSYSARVSGSWSGPMATFTRSGSRRSRVCKLRTALTVVERSHLGPLIRDIKDYAA